MASKNPNQKDDSRQEDKPKQKDNLFNPFYEEVSYRPNERILFRDSYREGTEKYKSGVKQWLKSKYGHEHYEIEECVCDSRLIRVIGKNAGTTLIQEGTAAARPSRTRSQGNNFIFRLRDLNRSPFNSFLSNAANWQKFRRKYALGDENEYQPNFGKKTKVDKKSSKRKKSKIVAVIDSGIDPLLSFKDEPRSLKFWKGQNKCIPKSRKEIYGWDFIENDEFPIDSNGHGTAVATTFAINFGLENDYRLMPLRALDSEGYGDTFKLACALMFAKKHGADYIILSLVTFANDPVLKSVLEELCNDGIAVIVASGNQGTELGSANIYPAEWGLADNCIIPVSGLITNQKKIMGASNYSKRPILNAARGEDVPVLLPTYFNMQTDSPTSSSLRNLDINRIFSYVHDEGSRIHFNSFEGAESDVQFNINAAPLSGTSFAAPIAAAGIKPKTMDMHERGIISDEVNVGIEGTTRKTRVKLKKNRYA